MKKTLSVLLALIFTFLMLPAVHAAEIFGVPGVSLKKTAPGDNDITYTFSVSCPDAAGYEAERRAVYEKLRAEYSDAMLIAAGQEWVIYETVLLMELETEGKTILVETYPATKTTITVSLGKDILPALVRTGLYTHAAFTYRLKFSLALNTPGNFTYASDAVTMKALACPATAHIVYDIDEDAENPNPAFPFMPYNDLVLKNPTRPGYVFAGWSGGKSGGYLSKIPANTEEITLTAHWTQRTFKINYVLTTRPGYFVYVDNTHNPLTRLYGEETPVYDLTAPYGYLFCGWYDNAALSGEPVTSIPADRLGDTVLYAKWLTPEEKDDETVRREHWGDPDGDGSITTKDARTVLRAAVGLDTFTKDQLRRVDYFGNGTPTTGAARQTLRFAIGLDLPREILRQLGRIS